MLLKIVIIFISIIAYKMISNYVKYKRCQKLSKMHLEWLTDKCDNFTQYKGEILALFKNADLTDSKVPVTQPSGYGQIASFSASTYLNFPSKAAVFAAEIANKFDQAVGVYHQRCLESLNPLYWIEAILFLPKNLLQYVGLDSEKVAFKLCNILLTFIWWLIGTLVIFFGPQIKQFILSLLS